MLQSVHVKNLALIEEIEIELENGMNVLTGETGAGKSIILGSIHLALGGKYSKDILRTGADYGFVELTFLVKEEHQIQKLAELDVFPEDDCIVLSRRLMEKRSVCRINGETVNVSTLKSVASILIDIYGQHEHQSLMQKKNHLDFVDAYGKDDILPQKKRVEKQYHLYTEIKKELDQASLDEAARIKELDFLNFEVNEISEANLKYGEDEALEEQYRMMVHSKSITENLSLCLELTDQGRGNASEQISRALRLALDVSKFDEKVAVLSSQLEEIENLLYDFNHDLGSYLSEHDFSDEDYIQTEQRLNDINRLKTKYGNTIEEILNYKEEKEREILRLEDYENYRQSLVAKLQKAEKLLIEENQKLTDLRKAKSKTFATQISDGLKELNFADVRFEIHQTEISHYTSNGVDELEFMIALNPGQPVRALTEVASGGELSRIMLAIKTVMASEDEIDTLIFDEIDVGISGRTAQKVAEKMAVIAMKHQVICITHLAQIASMADHHYFIHKEVVEGQTRTSIDPLNSKDSVNELARILGGAEITSVVFENATEMKKLADKTKEKLKTSTN